METVINSLVSIVSIYLTKKFGVNYAVHLSIIIGFFIKEYIKLNVSFLPNYFSQMEISSTTGDDEFNRAYSAIKSYVTENLADQMTSGALEVIYGTLCLSIPSEDIKITDTFNGHSITIKMVEEKRFVDYRRPNKKIYIYSWTATLDTLKLFVEKILKQKGGLTSGYTLFTPVFKQLRDTQGFSVRWGPGVKVKFHNPLDKIVLSETVRKLLDMDKFIKDKERYDLMNQCYSRSYLLYGPPGTGKSSIIAAFATKYNLNVFRIILNQLHSDEHLNTLIRDIESDQPYVLVFEDIDRSFNFTGENKGVSLSCLINVLDGLEPKQNRITFITLNDETVLESCKVLFRPGRVDVKILVPYCDAKQVMGIFCSFFPETKVDEERIKIHQSNELSPARLVNILGEYFEQPELALERIYQQM